MDQPNEGRKDDAGKLRYDLIPPEAEHALAAVLTMGAAKYGDHNWRGGIKQSRLVAALRRHLSAWVVGEIIDDESGYSHLWHVLCNAAFLVANEQRPELDDIYMHQGEDDTHYPTS